VANGARCPKVIRNDGGRPETWELGGAPTRELAQRLTGGVEVLLLWHPDIDSVELSLQDGATGAGFQIEVAPEDAIDAFYHPYAYASGCDANRQDEGTINDD
jgi:hypothetical protein